MKKYTKYIKNLFAISLSVFALSACSEDTMDKINSNSNNPLSVDAKFIVPDLQLSTAFSVVGGDLSLYASVYMEQEAGVHGQMFNAETRTGEPISTSTYNNVWNSLYSNIKNAKVIIKKCSTGGAEDGSEITLGIGKIYLAYNAAVLADLFGDVPYFQAGEINESGLPAYLQPAIDKQEDIYKDVIKLLDEAIVLFDGKDAGPFGAVGAKDLIYGGGGAAWKKAAYGLKARYTMRLLNKTTDKNKALQDVLNYVSKSFASASEEFKFSSYDGDANVNPLAAFSYSREALAASKSLFDKFAERKDPRTLQVLLDASGNPRTDMSKADLAPNGTVVEKQGAYDYMLTDYSWDAPTLLMSYHELLFLKAEALARLNNKVEAEEALQAAITGAFANLAGNIASGGFSPALSAEVSSKYYTDNVKDLFTANPLKEIMIQKYLSFIGAGGESIETYSDYRRMKAMGENFITLANPKNTETQFPLRFTYGNSDVLANSNFEGLAGDGTYVYKENVWWAGGSR